jgi:hypothetical protein
MDVVRLISADYVGGYPVHLKNSLLCFGGDGHL